MQGGARSLYLLVSVKLRGQLVSPPRRVLGTELQAAERPCGDQTRGVSPLTPSLAQPSPTAGLRPGPHAGPDGGGGSALTRRPSLPPALALARRRRLRGADGSPGLLGNSGGGGPGAGAARAPGEVRLRARPASALRRQGAVATGRSVDSPRPRPQPPGRGGPLEEAVSALLGSRRIPARSIPARRAGPCSAGKRSPPAPVPARVCSRTCPRGAPARRSLPPCELPALTRLPAPHPARWHRTALPPRWAAPSRRGPPQRRCSERRTPARRPSFLQPLGKYYCPERV